MVQIKFLGTGSAFTMPKQGTSFDGCDWQSNLLVIAESGKKLLLDCGSDVRFSLREQGFSHLDIDAVYVSHLHADHIGGLEWLAFATYFDPRCKRPSLFCASTLAGPLWQSLKGGLESIEGKVADITEYFDLRRVRKNGYFVWEGIRFELVQVVHVMAERTIKHSYGLMIMEDGKDGGEKIFWTSDTQFCPNQIKKFYADATLILQDCETCPPEFKSGVHAHWDDLRTLPAETKKKMRLYHYQPGGPETHNATENGFGGFIRKGSEFVVNRVFKRN